MSGGFIAFRYSNYDTTVEREQFRLLCKKMKSKYFNSEHFYLLVANYNIYDCEFDALVIKNDAIIAIEFKNYGGKIIATENGDWTADGINIRGGSRKTVYQQARINHASLRNGLNELGVNNDWIKDIATIIVFNKPIILDNQLSGKAQSWLHITDNEHFIEKIEDITCRSTYLSNLDIVNLAIRLNLNSFIVQDLSSYSIESVKSNNASVLLTKSIDEDSVKKSSFSLEMPTNGSLPGAYGGIKIGICELLQYDRFTPNCVFNLKPNQIFVFGTDRNGSQKYGAAGMAARRFGAQIGVAEGKTGNCYALPTKGFTIAELNDAVVRFKDFVDNNPQFSYLITPVGCGHAGLNVSEVSKIFAPFVVYKNVMLPKLFIDEYFSLYENRNSSTAN